MPEWRPGVLEGLLTSIERQGRANQRKGLLLIAAAIEAKAKAKLSQTSHPYGTKSPASKGQPPSLVSGTGRRSVGHQLMGSVETIVRIGTLANVYPPARQGRQSSTPSSKYLLYQEKLGRFNHPFLLPSYHEVVRGQTEIWLKSFREWPRI